MSEGAKILVRGVNWLGDAVMTTPALQRLREAHPAAHITLLTPAKLADLWSYHPAITEVMTLEPGESVWSVGRRLRQAAFQIGLLFPNSPRAALELWLGGVPQRIGYARPWRNWWLTQALKLPPGLSAMRQRTKREIKRLVRGAVSRGSAPTAPALMHQCYHYLRLVQALGGSPELLAPRLEVRNEEVAAARRRFGLALPGNIPLLGLNAGAEYGPAKRWPPERFIAAAIEFQKQVDCCWLVLGGPGEVILSARIAAEIDQAWHQRPGAPTAAPHPGAINLAGATSLRELCATLRACRALLTNDTGPMHVAAALGTPVVVPFGSTSPELTGPGLPGGTRAQCVRAPTPCSPCFRRTCPIDFRCMTGIRVETIMLALRQALASL